MNDIKMLPNIDTIYILVDIENYEENTKDIVSYLLKEKEKTKELQLTTPNYSNILTINNMNFEILSNGKKGYAILLKNDSFEIDIAQYKSKLQNFAPIQVRISSNILWSTGIVDSWSIIYNWIVETFGNIISEKVCRLDLCCHISNMDFVTNYESTYKGNFKKRQTFYTNSKINCITFGSRKGKNIYCRIYNKSLEILETHKKYWFYDIWQNNNMDINNIWNIEFEIKSELLRNFNIYTVHEIIEHLQDLWLFCTNKWLIKIDRTNKRVERCDINQDWLIIQKAYEKYKTKGLITKQKQIELDAMILVPNIVGNITAYSARKGKTNIDEAFSNLYKDTKKYLLNKDTSFEKEVNNKIMILGNCEVRNNE